MNDSARSIRVAGEDAVVGAVRLDDAWALVEDFSTLVRHAGSEEESQALRMITARLDSWDIDYKLHKPEVLIGLPGRASLVVDGDVIHAKTPSMAAATPERGLTAPIVYESAAPVQSVSDLLAGAQGHTDVAGKVVLTEGFPMPARVADLGSRGAAGVIAIAPGDRIHEMICTPIWGSPDLVSWPRRPALPVISIARPDGDRLIERLEHPELEATLMAEQHTGWRKIPVLVAEIPGHIEPDRFVLVHGHLDSWHVGVGDNATGDAALLELARVLGRHRHRLARSVRIAWWSGHSQGRYAGSTWYADEHALDIESNCICHINCDSPGCRDAEVFEDLFWMSEAEVFAQEAIRDFTGQESSGHLPPRAGDISFSNIGVSTFFMLTSTMSTKLRAEKDYYPVGGCGGNIEWHTEADTLHVADRDNLLRDMRLYAGSTFRAANTPVHPLDFRPTASRIEEALSARGDEVGDFVDLSSTFGHLKRLRLALESLYDGAHHETVEAARPVNDALIRIGRELVRTVYCSAGRYRQDPAQHATVLPEVAAAVDAIGTVPDGVVRTELTRVRNRIDRALLNALAAAEENRSPEVLNDVHRPEDDDLAGRRGLRGGRAGPRPAAGGRA